MDLKIGLDGQILLYRLSLLRNFNQKLLSAFNLFHLPQRNISEDSPWTGIRNFAEKIKKFKYLLFTETKDKILKNLMIITDSSMKKKKIGCIFKKNLFTSRYQPSSIFRSKCGRKI